MTYINEIRDEETPTSTFLDLGCVHIEVIDVWIPLNVRNAVLVGISHRCRRSNCVCCVFKCTLEITHSKIVEQKGASGLHHLQRRLFGTIPLYRERHFVALFTDFLGLWLGAEDGAKCHKRIEHHVIVWRLGPAISSPVEEVLPRPDHIGWSVTVVKEEFEEIDGHVGISIIRIHMLCESVRCIRIRNPRSAELAATR